MKKTICSAICMLFFAGATLIFAQNGLISASGAGATKDDALADAFATLSAKLYTDVQSLIISQTKDRIQNGQSTYEEASIEETVRISTAIPIFGADISTGKTKKQITATVTLSKAKSLPEYEKEMKKTAVEIDNLLVRFSTAGTATDKEAVAQLLAPKYEYFGKLCLVARFFDSSQIPELAMSFSQFSVERNKNAQITDSYARAAAKLTEAFRGPASKKGKKIFVYPPLYQGRNSVTDFSVSLQQYIAAEFGSFATSTAMTATFFLRGTYVQTAPGKKDTDLRVTYSMYDTAGNVLAASPVIVIPNKVFASEQFIPAGYDFQRELATGNIVDSDFRTYIRINGDTDTLSYRKGDILTIEVKATEPCFIYLVGYVFDERGEKFSYLFPFHFDEAGAEKFIRRISAEEANRWVCLNPVIDGEVVPIEIAPPFGMETLQIFASTEPNPTEFAKRIPSFTETEEYFVIDGSPAQVLGTTRGLNIKKAGKAAAKTRNAESFVSWTSRK